MIQSQGIICRSARARRVPVEVQRGQRGTDRHGERLRRDHHRRGAQRADERGVLRPRRGAGPWCSRHEARPAARRTPARRSPITPRSRSRRTRYVMSLMPPTIIRELNLKQHGYDVTPFGPYYQAFPDGRAITVYADDAKKSYDSIAQFSKKDADTLPKWEAWLKGVADVLGPLLLQVPPKLGSLAIGDLVASAQSAWKMRKLGTRGVADVTRLFTMSVSDLLGRLVRVGRDQGDADRERRDRHVGGSGRARHRVRDAAPLDRRRRRRTPRLVGLPAGWHGRRLRLRSAAPPSRSARRSAPTRAWKQILVRGGRAVGVALENGEELRAPVVVSCIHPQIAFLDLIERARAAGRLRLGHRAVEDARAASSKVNVALVGAAGLHREPRQEPAGPPHRLGRAVLQPAVRGARVPGRAHRAQGRGGAVRRRHDPDHARQAARARGGARVLDVQPVGAGRLEHGAAPRRARGSTPTGSSTSTRSSRRTSRLR